MSIKRWLAAYVLLVGWSAFAADRPDWLRLAVGQAKTAEAIYVFGIPDTVQTNLTWGEFAQHQSKPVRLDAFSLVYLPLRGQLTVLNGPLGRASSALLDFDHDVLVARQWKYIGPTLSSAMAAWTSDPSTELRQTQKLLISAKSVGNLTLTVSCPTNGRTVVCEGELNAYLGPTVTE